MRKGWGVLDGARKVHRLRYSILTFNRDRVTREGVDMSSTYKECHFNANWLAFKLSGEVLRVVKAPVSRRSASSPGKPTNSASTSTFRSGIFSRLHNSSAQQSTTAASPATNNRYPNAPNSIFNSDSYQNRNFFKQQPWQNNTNGAV